MNYFFNFITFLEFFIVNATTIVRTKNPAPNNDPILYDKPSSLSLATIAVIKSPAPLANANKVTPANPSLN